MLRQYFILALSLITFLFVCISCEETEETDADTGATIIDEDTLLVSTAIRFPNRLIEYKPAPGQFINSTPALEEHAESIIDTTGMVTLGGWGGYITVGFSEAIVNQIDTLYGVDFTIIGNSYEGSSEPGIVMVMCDDNGNGEADDTWYELEGSLHQETTTIKNYQVTYYHTNDSVVTWKDNQGQSDTLLRNGYHSQSYYPLSDNYPTINQDSITFTGTRLQSRSIEESAGHWTNPNYGYGYADNNIVNYGVALNLPDDPSTPDVAEGCGGDAFDLEWAVDSLGDRVELDSIHFIKIYNGVFDANPVLGDVSTEIKAIVPTI